MGPREKQILLLTCSPQGFGAGCAKLGDSSSPSPAPLLPSIPAALLSLWFHPRESLLGTVDCFMSLPGHASAPGSAHTHRLGNQGGTLCCDPGLTPKTALPPVPEPGWVLYQHLCSSQVASSHPEGRKTSAGHVLNITEEGKMQTLGLTLT